MPGISLHTLKPAHGSRSRRRRVGRGEGSGRGKTSGRGTKGQRSRSGGKSGLKLKGMKQMLLRIPKKRGFTSGRVHPATVTLEQLARWFDSGSEVSVKLLKSRNLIPEDVPGAKVVNTGTLTKKFVIIDLECTPGAKAAIEKAGGSIQGAVTAGHPKVVLAKKPLKK